VGDVDAALDRRLRRLREELTDEQLPLPLDGPAGLHLLGEMHYARRPPFHENRVPRYGALVFPGVPDWDRSPQVPVLVPADRIPVEVLRRFADGRSSFTVTTPQGLSGLASFEHSLEDEVAAVRLQRTGATVVQRSASLVRVARPVVSSSGTDRSGYSSQWPRITCGWWLASPPNGDRAVLAGLLEFAVHSLAAARVGATLVWNVDGCAPDDPRRGLADRGGARMGPALSVARRDRGPPRAHGAGRTVGCPVGRRPSHVGAPVHVRRSRRPCRRRLRARTGDPVFGWCGRRRDLLRAAALHRPLRCTHERPCRGPGRARGATSCSSSTRIAERRRHRRCGARYAPPRFRACRPVPRSSAWRSRRPPLSTAG